MLIPCNIRVITTAADLRQLYAIYLCRDIDSTVQYVGVTPLSELFTLADAACNSEWAEIYGKPLTTLDIEVHALTAIERDAYLEQRRLIAVHGPRCNKVGFQIATHRQGVICNETGEIWTTVKDASVAHGVAYSQLHNHLNRKPGYKSVKGRTYSRTTKAVR